MLSIVRQCPLCFFLKGKDDEWIPCDTLLKEAIHELCAACTRSAVSAANSQTDSPPEGELVRYY